jgi:polyisoprenoid-binding protein YceI
MKSTLVPVLLVLAGGVARASTPAAAAAPAPAAVGAYTRVLPQQSRILFTYTQMGVALQGSFSRFAAELSFDPARPATAHASFDVDLASIDAGSADANGEVAGSAWFNTRAFPVARFATSAVRALGGNRYEFTGQLSIKGRTHPLVVPATFGADGALDGAFTLHRGDFAIGEGEWAAFDVVANDVQVRFHILAAR